MATAGPPSPKTGLLTAAQLLAVDAGTVEVITALRSKGIESILLKGPAFSTLLYDTAEERSYADADLLVAPDRFGAAEAELRALGFERAPAPDPPPGDVAHAEPWERSSTGAAIDLHRTLFGVGVPPEAVWPVLAGRLSSLPVAGVSVPVLDAPARLMLVCLHAVQHGDGRPIEDVRRAVERCSTTQWREALDLADRLDAGQTMAAGMRLAPGGEKLAAQMDVVDPEIGDAALHRGARGPLAVGFGRLASTPGVRPKAALVLREVFPSPAYLRFWRPLARRGPAGLALAYLWRPLWLLWHTPASLIAWRRSRPRRSAP